MNVGVAVVATPREAVLPAGAETIRHENVSGSDSGSKLPEPSSVTWTPMKALRSPPAFATGGRFVPPPPPPPSVVAVRTIIAGSPGTLPSETTSVTTYAPGTSGTNAVCFPVVNASVAALPPGFAPNAQAYVSPSPSGSLLVEPSRSAALPTRTTEDVAVIRATGGAF